MAKFRKHSFSLADWANPTLWQRHQKIIAGFTVLVVATVGVYLLAFSHAAAAYGPIVGQGSYCLDNWLAKKVDFNTIDLYPCNGSAAQQWSYNPTTGSITNSNGYCLDDSYNDSAVGSKVDLYQCNGSAAQKWVVNATAGTIVHGSLCLDNKYGVVTPENPIWLYTCNGTAAQHWSVSSGGTSSAPVSVAPKITSAASASFTVGTAASFTVADTGTPAPTLAEAGTLPGGLNFSSSSGILSGTPTTAGSFVLTFTASNGVSPNAVQTFNLTIASPPTSGGGGGSGGGGSGGSSSSTATPASLMTDSIFNQAVTSWAVDPNSAEFVSDFVTDYKNDYGNVGVNFNDPFFSVPANTANSSVSVTSGCNNFLPSTGTEVPIPSDVVLSGSSDNPLFLYSTSLNKVWELWQASKTSSGYEACWGGEMPLTSSSGVFPAPYGESATGISYLATGVSEADVASGSINHAIAFILPVCNGYVYPADRTDCGSEPGQPGEGQWFRFSPSATLPSGLSPFADMVFKAIQKYGMVVVDKGGAVQISAENPADWAAEGNSGTDPITTSTDGQPEYSVINSLPWSQLQVVDPPNQ